MGLALSIFHANSATAAGHAIGEMIAWASDVEALVRGPMDIADPGLGNASHGTAQDALGPASGASTATVSLGDGGSITLGFDEPVADLAGDDFAVFENGFFSPAGLFAEFAFVEISTNGIDFARFDAITTRTALVPPFGPVDPADYSGFAGDEPAGTGTGFDLGNLASHPLVGAGVVDLQRVRYVKLIDVIGKKETTTDALGNWVHDPYETPFSTGGFDVDGVGVIHAATSVPVGGVTLWLTALLIGLTGRRLARRPSTAGRRGAPIVGLVLSLGLPGAAWATLDVDFEDLGIGPDSFYDGSDGAGGFTSHGAGFGNSYDPTFGAWEGWSASTTTDTMTPGFGNQYSAISGGGQGGSDTYGVSYAFTPSSVSFADEFEVMGAYLTNATYSYLAMQGGGPFGFSKQFGGTTGDDPDFFMLTITGIAGGSAVGSVDFYLADYRFTDNTQDYLIDDWTWVDLTSLGAVSELRFSLSSTDNDLVFGMNTPAYFAMDSLIYAPEPRSAALLAVGLAALGATRRR